MPSLPSRPRYALAVFTLIAGSLSLALPVATQSLPAHAWIDGHEVVEGEVLVKYRDQYQTLRHAQIESMAGADEVEAIDRSGLRRLHSGRLKASELLSALQDDPDVEFAEPNYVLYAARTANDPFVANRWRV